MKPPRSKSIVLDVANPNAMKRGSLIVLDLPDDETAMHVARKIAEATGRAVTVRDANNVALDRIAAATSH